MTAKALRGDLIPLLDLLGSRLHPDDLLIVTNHGWGRMTVEARIAGRVALVEVPRRQSFIVWPAARDFIEQTGLGAAVPEEPGEEAGPAPGGEGPKVVRLAARPGAGEQA